MIGLGVIMANYYYVKKSYIPRKINIPRKCIYTQTAGNCWIYRALENLYLNTGIEVDPQEVKDCIASFGFATEGLIGNDMKYAAAILCYYLEQKYPDKKIRAYEVDIMYKRNNREATGAKLCADLRKNGYALGYSRDCHDNVLQDIADDKEIDDIIITKGLWHAVNLCFENKKLTEYGTWSKTSIYNNFAFKDTNVFMKSIRAGAIPSKLIFLDFQH